MKNLFLLFIAFLLLQFTTLAQEGWFEQISGTTEHLNSITCIDDNTGWIVGNDGTILNTSDGGNNWISQQSATTEDLYTVYFIDNLTGWACGGNIVLKTTDAGATWLIFMQANNDTSNYQSIYFIDNNIGWISEYVGENSGSIIYKTTDGGSNWVPQYNTTSYTEKIPQIKFLNQNIGWAVIDNQFNSVRIGKVLKTTNSGQNWIVQYEFNLGFISIDFIDGDICWVLGQTYIPLGGFGWGSHIFKTTNGGNNWEHQQEFTNTVLGSICIVNSMEGWSMGDCGGGRIFTTTNGGEMWFEQNFGYVSPLNSGDFISNNTGWAVGWYGTILHTTNGGVSFIEEEENDGIPTDHSLSQNYPNPFNPNTKIRYSVPQSSNIVIKVFDMLGNEIETLVNEEKGVDVYEITWYAEDLPSGVYFYQLKAGDFVETKKMILIK